MAKRIIEISDKIFNSVNKVTTIDDINNLSVEEKACVFRAIKNSTPLFKGYKRLIDADKLLENQYRIDDSATLCTRDVVDVEDIEDAPTVEAIPIPIDATNEDVLKTIFPSDADDIIKYIKTAILNGWLISKYKGE